jgi:hypothetical protein
MQAIVLFAVLRTGSESIPMAVLISICSWAGQGKNPSKKARCGPEPKEEWHRIDLTEITKADKKVFKRLL